MGVLVFPYRPDWQLLVIRVLLAFRNQGGRPHPSAGHVPPLGERCFTFGLKMLMFSLILGILVTATKDKNNHYPYNPTTTVLLSEVLKLLVSSVLFIKE